MEVRCPEGTFVHMRGHFCGSLVPRSGFCPQTGYLLWMRRGNSNRLSTNKAHFVDEMGLCGCHGLRWCLSGAFVSLSGPAMVPLGTCDGAPWEPLCAFGSLPRSLSEPSGSLREDYHSNCSLTGKRPNMPPVWMNRMFFAPTSAPPSFSSL